MWTRRYVVLASLIAACAPPYDPTRVEADPGTFGEHVVTLLCKRLAWQADPLDVSGDHYRDACRGGELPPDAPPTLVALASDRARLVAAIDTAVLPDATDALQAYLTSDAILALYDDDTMGTSIASLGDLLDQLGSDDAAMGALARIGARDGYRRPEVAIGQAGAMLSSPDITAVLDGVLPAIVEGGAAHAEWTALVDALSATFTDAAAPGTPDRPAAIANKLLVTEHAELGEAAPLLSVRRDRRGAALLAGPIVDTDGDGLADLDAVGRFVDAQGALLALPTPFPAPGDTAMRDPDGRAVDGTGAPIYQYLDLAKTLSGALGHDTYALLDPARGTALDLVRGSSLLLGDRAPQTRTFDDGATLAYRGYDTTNAPLLDMAYAFTQLLRDPSITDTLALSDQLFGAHQAATARLLEAAITAARLGDAHPEAEILADAPLWDDMWPLLQRITANPKLVSDLLDALKRPEVKLLSDRFREQMSYKDRFDIDPNTQALVGGFATQPDRTQPDTGFNRSVFQRLLNLIADSNGATQCNKQGAVLKQNGLVVATYNACELFRVDNLAVFYLQSIAYAKDAQGNIICEDNGGDFNATRSATTPQGCAAFGAGWRPRPKADFNYNWNKGLVSPALIGLLGGDQYVENNATIVGFRTHPTPQALNRVLFLDPTPQAVQDTSDPMRDKDGDLYKEQHAGTLPVWEKNNFFEQIRPIVQAFADANQEQTFVDLMTVLHKHWSSKLSTSSQHTAPAAGNYTYGSNVVSFEPLVTEILQGDLWPTLTETAAELTAIVANGKSLAAITAHAGHYLVTPQAGLADRLGRTTTRTSDGRAVAMLSPWQLLADAYVAKRARLAASTDAALWTDSTSEVVDLLFRGHEDATGWHFRNTHIATMTRGIVQLLRDRIAVHDQQGDRAAWLAQDLPHKVEDLLTHPVLAAATDLVAALDGPPRLAVEQLLHGLFDPAQPAFATMRTTTGELIQLALDDDDLVPLAHVAGALLAKPYLPVQIALLAKLHAADSDHTLNDIVARLFRAQEPGIPVISAIADGVGDVDRLEPGPARAWTAPDYASVLRTVAAFFHEEQRGLPRFIAIVKGRNP
jgi:hypothetical protein